MSLDLVLYHANGPATIRNALQSRGLASRDPETNEWTFPAGVYIAPWNETGKVMRAPGTYDAEGNELTPPTYIPGFAVIIRFAYDVEENDRIEGDTDEDGDTIPEEDRDTIYGKSQIVRFIKKNGTLGQAAGIPYYEMPNGLRFFRYEDVTAKCAEWGTPGHVFL